MAIWAFAIPDTVLVRVAIWPVIRIVIDVKEPAHKNATRVKETEKCHVLTVTAEKGFLVRIVNNPYILTISYSAVWINKYLHSFPFRVMIQLNFSKG